MSVDDLYERGDGQDDVDAEKVKVVRLVTCLTVASLYIYKFV